MKIKYEKYHNDREVFKDKANAIEAIYAQSSQRMQELNLKVQKAVEQEAVLKQSYGVELSKLNDNIDECSTVVIEQEQALRGLEQKNKEYELLKIGQLVQEDKKEKEYNSQLQIAKINMRR